MDPSLFLFLLLLAVNYTFGAKGRNGGHETSRRDNNLSPGHSEHESRSTHDTARQSYHEQSMFYSNPQQIHPELEYRSHQPYLSSNSPDRQGSRDHEKNFNTEIYSIIEDLSNYYSINTDASTSIMLQKLIDNAFTNLHSSKSIQTKRKGQSFEPSIIQSTVYNVQESSIKLGEPRRSLTDPTLKVELTPGSGVMINKKTFDYIVKNNYKNQFDLQRRIFEELINPKILATMTPSYHRGYKPVPHNVRNAVEEFFRTKTEYKVNHIQFMNSLRSHLQHLRQKYNIKREYTKF